MAMHAGISHCGIQDDNIEGVREDVITDELRNPGSSPEVNFYLIKTLFVIPGSDNEL